MQKQCRLKADWTCGWHPPLAVIPRDLASDGGGYVWTGNDFGHAPSAGHNRENHSLRFRLAAHLVFLGTFCYAIGFVTGVVVPKTIDWGR